uniref:DNA polymerase n=1 Tax=Fagus sylvatica TaxID=28930 RepID=A0A2N9FAW5_FAGSY
MADTQADSNVFSVRIVSIDYYMAAPISGLDFCYSSFQGGKVNEVPVIRIYGSTPTGQKTCLHIHKPSKYTPCVLEGDAHTQAVFLALEKALKIDYNLYGMGHMHLSKMKFRHPVPDTFSPRKSDRIGLQNQKMDKLTCMANDFQADPNCDASLSSPIWISSTIPADWIWQFPSEFEASSHQDVCCVKRQSVCELEGDASIDDILNQQFKNYSSLSQTHSEVKMVQSLVPIWEEEYERTGMRDVAMPSDPSKPLPDDVLRTLSLGLEFENKLIELCGETENTLALNPLEKNVKLLQSMTSATDEGNLVGLGHTNPDNRDGESLKYSKEKDIMGSLSPQGSIREEEIPTEGRDTSIKPLSIDEMRTSAIIETLDPKATDEEALGLLRWLATSQAGEDINSDDELVRETILSPLLPATTIDKVLEKANMDYESESQKECQDILDSIDDLSDFEGLKEGASHCSDQNHSSISSSEKMIPQIDGSADDLFSSSLLTNKHKRKQSIWGSLPFSMMQRQLCRKIVYEVEMQMTDVHDLKESCTLVGCSVVRDLMRRKRSYRVEPDLMMGQLLIPGETYEVTLSQRHTNINSPVPANRSLSVLEVAMNVDLANFGSHEKGHGLCKPKTIDSAASMGHREIDNVKESSFGVTAIAIERFQQIGSVASSCLQTGMVECGVSGADCSMYESGHKDEPSLVGSESVLPLKKNCIGMTFGTPVWISPVCSCQHSRNNVDRWGIWTDGASENASFTLTTTSNLEEDNFGGSSDNRATEVNNTKGSQLSKHNDWTFWSRTQGLRETVTPPGAGNGPATKIGLGLGNPNLGAAPVDKHARISDSNSDQVVIGVPTHCQNDGSYLYLLTPVLSPPSTDSVYRWLLCDEKGAPGGNNVASVDSSPLKGSASSLIGTQSFLPDDCDKDLPESGSGSHISGPDGKSKPTPLSQSGFRDPASVGGGQQLTLLSIEVQAESRGDLRPNPRFDAINVIALAIQNDTDSIPEVYVLLRSKTEAFKRSLDGTSGCKMLVFSEEKYLFSHFMKIVCSSDPDIIMGWDIQGGSLGFLAERASHLGIGLLNNISRTPSEIKIAAGDLDIPEKGNFDNLIPEQSNADPVILEDAIIEDEWGRTHASGVHVGGRIVLNIWRLMRGEVKLNMYTIEAVAEAVLRRKIPSFRHKVLTKWFSSGPGRGRFRCIEYVMERARLNLEIMNQLDMINRTSELARVFGIDFFSVLSRGSQYRVESMLLRLAHTQNYLAISPGSQQVASQPAMECLPLVMEPESGFYADPVVVLDFQSLYPSMIIAYNLCFSTCLGKVAPSKANTLGVSSFSPDPYVLQSVKNEILLTPNGVMYVTSKVRKGIMPRLLEEILSTRIMVKQAMKRLSPSQQILHRVFNARQLALKLISNVTYGYTAAGFSGRMPCAELADSIVQCGRSTLEKAISFVNAHDKWKAKVIYGDTDSLFVLLKGRTVKESFQIGNEIASAITAMNPKPVTLKMEKVYHPCFLLTKKRYVGYSYESPEQTEPVFDAKGIETVRRDTCGAVAKTLEKSLRHFFEHQDISEVKAYLQRQWTRILSGRVSLQNFVFAKEVRLGTYCTRGSSSLPPAAIVATKAMRADPRAEPCYAERIPYVVIHGEPGARLIDMVVDPLELLAMDSSFRLNDLYYINKQIIPALQRVFGLVGADLNQWFIEMPRPAREAFAKRPFFCSKSTPNQN